MNSFALNSFRIPVRQIEAGTTLFEIRVTDPDLVSERDGCFKGEIRAEAEVTSLETDILVQLRVESKADLVCDRCGERFSKKLSGTVKTLYSRDRLSCTESESDDVKWLSPQAQEIDVREDVRDALALAIPAKVLCREKCRGLCPQCGAQLNRESCSCAPSAEDSRWDALKKLKK